VRVLQHLVPGKLFHELRATKLFLGIWFGTS
jgi:hypothetical protein